MKEGVQINAYIHWLTRSGKPQLVTPIEFIGMRRNQKGHIVTFYDADDNPYNGEVWKCRTSEGKIQEFTFPVESQKDELVGWSYNQNPIDDEQCNLHFDHWEFDGKNYTRVNKTIEETDKEIKVKQILESIVAVTSDPLEGRIAQTKLMLLTTPSMRIVNEWKTLLINHPDEVIQLNLKLEI